MIYPKPHSIYLRGTIASQSDPDGTKLQTVGGGG